MKAGSLWKNPAGWPLVLFFLIGGIAFTVAMPSIWIGQIWIAVAILVGVVFFFIASRAKRQEEIRRTGIPATATILELTQTGMEVNNQPVVEIKMRVEASGMAPFEVEKRATVPLIALGRLSSGQPLSVYVDRDNPSQVEIDWSGGGAGMMPMTVQSQAGETVQVTDPAARQAAMDAMRQHGVNTSGGGVDLRSNPAARQAVLEALRKHGVDVAHQTAAADPSTPVQKVDGDSGRTLDRLQKLMELKNAQLISDEEFAAHKERILKEI